MERSQDEIMNSSDSVRDSQGKQSLAPRAAAGAAAAPSGTCCVALPPIQYLNLTTQLVTWDTRLIIWDSSLCTKVLSES